jgi:hypothetical protein
MRSVSKTYRFRRARVVVEDESGKTFAIRLDDGTATIRLGDDADAPLRIEVGGIIGAGRSSASRPEGIGRSDPPQSADEKSLPGSRWVEGTPKEPGDYWIICPARSPDVIRSEARYSANKLVIGAIVPGQVVTHHMPVNLTPPDPPEDAR